MTVADKVLEAAHRHGVPGDLAIRQARQESGFNQSAVSSAGAIGVMQLMPATARELGVNPYDLDQNIEGGMRYLRQMYSLFGSWPLALAAYNAGPGKMRKVLDGKAALPSETAKYVHIITGRELFDQTPGPPEPPGFRPARRKGRSPGQTGGPQTRAAKPT